MPGQNGVPPKVAVWVVVKVSGLNVVVMGLVGLNVVVVVLVGLVVEVVEVVQEDTKYEESEEGVEDENNETD